MSNIVELLAKKENIDIEQADYIIKNLWQSVKKEISKGKGKDVLLHGLGTFYIDKRNLKYKIFNIQQALKRLEDNFQLKKDIISHIDWISYIERYIILNKELNKAFKMQHIMNKRENRVKGERGL